MLPEIKNFDQLPLVFEGNSRILRQHPDSNLLVSKLKPTVFCLATNGPITILGIEMVRTKLNAILCDLLHKNGIKTSTINTKNEYIFMEKHQVPPIEVVVKSALVGSPKHIYKGILETQTRYNESLRNHAPYVRFDWRNPLPYEDSCMPTSLADYFIDTKQASTTALNAFEILKLYFYKHDLELIDICFFMNTAGDVICGEISTDNCRLEYIGSCDHTKKLLSSKEKDLSLEKTKRILQLLEHQ